MRASHFVKKFSMTFVQPDGKPPCAFGQVLALITARLIGPDGQPLYPEPAEF